MAYTLPRAESIVYVIISQVSRSQTRFWMFHMCWAELLFATLHLRVDKATQTLFLMQVHPCGLAEDSSFQDSPLSESKLPPSSNTALSALGLHDF